MKINFSQELKDFRTGEVMTWQSGVPDTPSKPMTLGFCCSEALLMPSSDNDSGKKTADLMLATKVFVGGELDVTSEQVVRLKERVSAAYPSALVAGQCCALLEGLPA